MTTSSLSLPELVRSSQDAGALTPREITDRIIPMLGNRTSALKAALELTLPAYVHSVQSRMRLGINVPRTPSAHSGRVSAIRQSFGVNDVVIPLSEGAKRLGDCVRADLLEYAETLRTHAQQTLDKAAWYESIATQLPDDNTTVEAADLDLGRAA